MISLPPCFCPTPFGVLLTFTLFEFSRRHLWSVTSPFWALADGCFCHPQMWISILLLPISQLLVVLFYYLGQVMSLPRMQEWLSMISCSFSPLHFAARGGSSSIARILPPLVLDIFRGFMQVFLHYSGKVRSIPWIVLSLPVPCYMPFAEGYSYIHDFSNPMLLPNSIRDLLTFSFFEFYRCRFGMGRRWLLWLPMRGPCARVPIFLISSAFDGAPWLPFPMPLLAVAGLGGFQAPFW